MGKVVAFLRPFQANIEIFVDVDLLDKSSDGVYN
jgi:hypothetical protein